MQLGKPAESGPRRHHMSLTATFVLVSIVSMVALAVTLVLAVGHQLRRQAVDEGVRTAQAYVGAGVRQAVQAEVFRDGQMSAAGRAELAGTLGRSGTGLLAVRLWTADGELIYDSLGAGPSVTVPDAERLEAAVVAGRARAAVIDHLQIPRRGAAGSVQRTVLDVYVPVRYDEDGRPVGAAEIMLDYAPTAVIVSSATRTVTLLVLGGFALLWVLLFRTVRLASRRLHHSASENAKLALLDPLTGLPNRRLISDRLAGAVAEAAGDDHKVALFLLDVDRFKEINDTLGHDHGDALLIQIAARLRGVVRSTDTVARLGGDEFAVLLPEVASLAAAEVLAQRVLEIFSEPYDLDGMSLHVDSSIGVALLPDHADDVTSLLRGADVAMYTAKASRRGYAVYSADGDNNSPARLVLLGDLRNALDVTDQLCLYYQPKVELATGEIAGFEALLRWQHPGRGLLQPQDFVLLAEQTGLMHRLTRHVLKLVIGQLATWSRTGLARPVAVNLSQLNLDEDDLAETVEALLIEHEVPAELLEFEITETAIVADPARAAQVLDALEATGVSVAIDDFGIGNTSLSQLRDLRVQALKIDRTFVSDVVTGQGHLVKVMTDLAHEFGLWAVAEGVEDAEIAQGLKELGCDYAQGWYFGRPEPAERVEAILRAAIHPKHIELTDADSGESARNSAVTVAPDVVRVS